MVETDPSSTLVYSSPAQFLEIHRLQQSTGRLVCLRVQRFQSFEDCRARQALFTLQQSLSHESVCEVYSVATKRQAGLWELKVELEWSGRDLDTLTRTEHPQGWEETFCAQLLEQVVWALAYAQEKEVGHRHIQPSSLFLTDSGLLKITDFGCAKALNSCAFGHTESGTPYFLCPVLRKAFTQMVLGEEMGQAECSPYKSDVYSLGLTVVYLLQPASLPVLGNQAQLLKTIAALPIHPKFQDTLRLMLEPEEANRPDFPALAAYLQAASSPQEEPSIPSAADPESESSALKKRRVRIVKKNAGEVPGFPDLPPKEASDVLEAQAPLSQRHCPCCLKNFSLALTEAWRLDLVGSSHSEVARNYCSLACFQRESTGPALQSAEETLAVRDTGKEDAEGPELNFQCMLIFERRTEDLMEQFLHCFQHTDLLPPRGFLLRSTPTILAQCPDCPTGELSRLALPMINKWVVHNSLYASLVFLEIPNTGYMLLSEKVLPPLSAGLCHFCTGQVNPCHWLGFLHNNTLALVCSLDCVLATEGCRNCPTCQAPLQPSLRESFPESATRIATYSEEAGSCCDLCYCGDNDYTLGCGHSLCRNCLAYIPRLDSPVFSCLFCGMIHCKEDYEGLF